MFGVLLQFIAWLLIWQVPHATAQDEAQGEVTLCGTSDYYNSTIVPYSWNNNAWGDNGQGYSCLRVLDGDTRFAVTYVWTGDSSTVKGFPYMKAHPARLPTQLWNITSLDFAAQWRLYVLGTENSSPEEQAQAYSDIGLRVNAAVDMFLSDNAENSTGLGAPIEVMIWPWYTPNVLPLGHNESTPDVDTIEIAGTNFSLYHGWNAQGQHVFSWLAHRNLTEIDADFGPLLRYIWERGLLSGALYVGQLEFGTEVMHASEETVFEAWNYTLRITREGDPDAPVPTTTSSASAPTETETGTQSVSVSWTQTVNTAQPTATGLEAASATANAASASLPPFDHNPVGLLAAMACVSLLTTGFFFMAWT